MDKKIIIYGAGKNGKLFFEFLKSLNLEKYIYCFCDNNAENTKSIKDIPVI